MAVKLRTCDPEEDLRDLFRTIDQDGSGQVTAEELRAFLENICKDLDADEVNQIVHDADADGSGEIEIDEFIDMIQQAAGDG